MDLYIYSDESGVFDYKHNEYFVFGGVIYLSKESKDESIREYTGVEKELRKRSSVKNGECISRIFKFRKTHVNKSGRYSS